MLKLIKWWLYFWWKSLLNVVRYLEYWIFCYLCHFIEIKYSERKQYVHRMWAWRRPLYNEYSSLHFRLISPPVTEAILIFNLLQKSSNLLQSILYLVAVEEVKWISSKFRMGFPHSLQWWMLPAEGAHKVDGDGPGVVTDDTLPLVIFHDLYIVYIYIS